MCLELQLMTSSSFQLQLEQLGIIMKVLLITSLILILIEKCSCADLYQKTRFLKDSQAFASMTIDEQTTRKRTSSIYCASMCNVQVNCEAFAKTPQGKCGYIQTISGLIETGPNSSNYLHAWLPAGKYLDKKIDHFVLIDAFGYTQDFSLNETASGPITTYRNFPNPFPDKGCHMPYFFTDLTAWIFNMGCDEKHGKLTIWSLGSDEISLHSEAAHGTNHEYASFTYQNGAFYIFGGIESQGLSEVFKQGKWHRIKDHPHGNNAAYGCATMIPGQDQDVFVMGGDKDSELGEDNARKVFRYNALENEYHHEHNLPHYEFKQISCIAIKLANQEDRILVIGGESRYWGYSYTYILDPNLDSWTKIGSFPGNSLHLTLQFVKEAVYAFGMGIQVMKMDLNKEYPSWDAIPGLVFGSGQMIVLHYNY